MGRRKNDPELVQELIDGRWTMDQDEFEEKYNSLSRSDMSIVADAIDGMEDEYYDGDDDIPEGCRACGGDYPNCKTSCPMYDD